MGVNLLRRATKNYHGMGRRRRLQMVQCIVHGWTTNGCNVRKERGQNLMSVPMSVNLIISDG